MRSVVIVALLSLLLVASLAAAESYVSVWGAEGAAESATSSWFGNVGLITIPSALTPPAGAATVTGHWIDTAPDSTTAVSVNFGATKDLEIGAAWIDPGVGSSEVIGNVKLRVPVAKWLEDEDLPQVAVGAFDVTDEINRAFYVVLSKTVNLRPEDTTSPRLTLHLGFADNEANAGPLDGIFAGAQLGLRRGSLIEAEYDGENFNADFRYNVNNRVTVDVGILDGDFGAGATYRSKF